jgi:hypothetical protein
VVASVPHEAGDRRRSGSTSADGVWAEVWTWAMERTPYSLFVQTPQDADRQLELLSDALGSPREQWTIKPPRGWNGYGMPLREPV